MSTYEETVWLILPGRGAPARRADKILENEPGAGSGLLQGRFFASGGSPGSVVGLASSWTASTTLFCPPAIPRTVRSTRTRSRTNTTVSSFQTANTVLPMLPASAGATAAKVLVCFCIMLLVKFPPWGGAKKKDPRRYCLSVY